MEWFICAVILSLILGLLLEIRMKRQGKHLNWRRSWVGGVSTISLDDASTTAIRWLLIRDSFISLLCLLGILYFIVLRLNFVFGPLFLFLGILSARAVMEEFKELKSRKKRTKLTDPLRLFLFEPVSLQIISIFIFFGIEGYISNTFFNKYFDRYLLPYITSGQYAPTDLTWTINVILLILPVISAFLIVSIIQKLRYRK